MSCSKKTIILYSQDRTIVMMCHGIYVTQNDDEYEIHCDTVGGVPVGYFKKKTSAMDVISKFARLCDDPNYPRGFLFKIPEDPETHATKEEW